MSEVPLARVIDDGLQAARRVLPSNLELKIRIGNYRRLLPDSTPPVFSAMREKRRGPPMHASEGKSK